LVRPRTINARATDVDSETDTLVNVATTSTSNLDRKAVLRGIQGMSPEERTQLLDELIVSDQSPLSF
jgi:hypothetical protein